MKNLFKFLGIISLVLVMGFSMTACKDDEGGDDNGGNTGGGPLVAKWYLTQEGANNDNDFFFEFEFTSDGKFKPLSGGTSWTYTSTDTTITFLSSGKAVGTGTYSITGTKLTLTDCYDLNCWERLVL